MLKLLSFWLGDELFGVEITKVKEINRNIEFTTVPRASDHVVGLFNMRGQVVTLFNLAIMLGTALKGGGSKATCIILKADAGSANQRGFVIGRTGDVIDVETEMCEPPPANVDARESKFIKAVVRLEKDLLRIVDTDTLFTEPIE